MVYKQAWSIKNYRYVWDVSPPPPAPYIVSHLRSCTSSPTSSDTAPPRWRFFFCMRLRSPAAPPPRDRFASTARWWRCCHRDPRPTAARPSISSWGWPLAAGARLEPRKIVKGGGASWTPASWWPWPSYRWCSSSLFMRNKFRHEQVVALFFPAEQVHDITSMQPST
jgi:hypothetical protein